MVFGEIDGFWWKAAPQEVPFSIKVINSEGAELEHTFTSDDDIKMKVEKLIDTGVNL